MKRVVLFLVLTLLLTVGFAVQAQQAQVQQYIIISNGDDLPNGLNGQVAKAGGVLTGRVNAIGLAFASSNNPNFASQITGVQAVIPDYKFSTVEPSAVRIQEEAKTSTSKGKGKGKGNKTTAAPDGDGTSNPMLPLLWGMDAINAPEAWAAGSTGAGATVFILDEGFDLHHPDLVFNTAKAESFVCYSDWWIEGYDEDGNPIYGAEPSNDPADCEPVDYMLDDVFSHGTHTSGTIGAEDNDIGVIGVAPNAEEVPVKVLSEFLGYGFSSWIMRGIVYAADNGADVINMSLGGYTWQGSGPGSNEVAAWRVAYNRAVQYAYNHNVTVVVSAGNQGIDVRDYPTLLINPGMTSQALTISATAPYGIAFDSSAYLDNLASYSTYGAGYVDFAAPGGDFQFYPDAGWWYDMVLSTGSQGAYYWSAGTSMAAPHAAGVAALIIAENGGDMNPALVAQEMAARATDIGPNGTDRYFGQGRVSTGY